MQGSYERLLSELHRRLLEGDESAFGESEKTLLRLGVDTESPLGPMSMPEDTVVVLMGTGSSSSQRRRGAIVVRQEDLEKLRVKALRETGWGRNNNLGIRSHGVGIEGAPIFRMELPRGSEIGDIFTGKLVIEHSDNSRPVIRMDRKCQRVKQSFLFIPESGERPGGGRSEWGRLRLVNRIWGLGIQWQQTHYTALWLENFRPEAFLKR